MSNLRFLMLSVAVFAAAFTAMSVAGLSRSPQGRALPPPAAVAETPPQADTPAAPAVTLAAHRDAETDDASPVPARAPSPGDAAPRLPTRPVSDAPHMAPLLPVQEPAAPPPARDGHDQIRETALQAATAYARTPCDAAARAAFVVAASSYIRTGAGETPDPGVLRAIRAAYQVGGVGASEFTAEAQPWIAEIPTARGPGPCAVGRQAAARR